MKEIKTDIIPSKVTFTGEQKTLDLKAICIFAATGFFLDDDTYFTEQKALKPATKYTFDSGNNILSREEYFKWHYNPKERSLKHVTEDFAHLFEQILFEQSENKEVILPLSGGLDSRSLACGLKHVGADVNAYSYQFQNGHDETSYAQKIAEVCNFPFQKWEVPQGYLWSEIDLLAQINGCYSEFTHPRQMAFMDRYKSLGNVFSLGHWGDVLFDDMGVDDQLSLESQIDILFKKVVKKGGLELAEALWKTWQLGGSFKEYLYERLRGLLQKINIEHSANAQIRAFKSLYWAPRWTSVNLALFEKNHPITLPYYDNRMCEFICSVPERHLAGRQIQIEYIKLRNPKLAKITWQTQRPFNLYTYHWNKKPFDLPIRVYNKLSRTLQSKQYTQRNWELQFLGKENSSQLESHLFNTRYFEEVVPREITDQFYQKFRTINSVHYSHPVSMLLTLSMFFKQREYVK